MAFFHERSNRGAGWQKSRILFGTTIHQACGAQTGDTSSLEDCWQRDYTRHTFSCSETVRGDSGRRVYAAPAEGNLQSTHHSLKRGT